VLLTTAIEAAVIKWIFKIPLHRWRLWILCAANGLSAGIAFVSLILQLGIGRVWHGFSGICCGVKSNRLSEPVLEAEAAGILV
jgi:hypothetical protein